MSDEAHAQIIPFPIVANPDAALNAEWDRLVLLAEEAWSWRDPESLAALARCLDGLAGAIGREWPELTRRAPPR